MHKLENRWNKRNALHLSTWSDDRLLARVRLSSSSKGPSSLEIPSGMIRSDQSLITVKWWVSQQKRFMFRDLEWHWCIDTLGHIGTENCWQLLQPGFWARDPAEVLNQKDIDENHLCLETDLANLGSICGFCWQESENLTRKQAKDKLWASPAKFVSMSMNNGTKKHMTWIMNWTSKLSRWRQQTLTPQLVQWCLPLWN